MFGFFELQVTEDQKLLREKVKHLGGDAGIERMESALSETRFKYFQSRKVEALQIHRLHSSYLQAHLAPRVALLLLLVQRKAVIWLRALRGQAV